MEREYISCSKMPDKFQLELEEALKKRKSVTDDEFGDIGTKDGDDFVNSFIKPKVAYSQMSQNLLKLSQELPQFLTTCFSHQEAEVSQLKRQKVRWIWMTIFSV